MTGARIEFTFRNKEFTDALARLNLSPARRRGLMGAIGVGLLHTTRDRFMTSSDPQGRGWAPLNPAYIAVRRPTRILIQQGDGGGLLGSLTYQVPDSNTVVVGSNKVYAAVHQFGATIRPKAAKALVFRLGGGLVRAARVTIPARPYLGFGPADEAEVLDALDVLLPGGR